MGKKDNKEKREFKRKKTANYINRSAYFTEAEEAELRRELKHEPDEQFYIEPHKPRKNRISADDSRLKKRWCKYSHNYMKGIYLVCCPHRLIIIDSSKKNPQEAKILCRTYYRYRQILLNYTFEGWTEYNGK